jgi:DnaK suppressor protein
VRFDDRREPFTKTLEAAMPTKKPSAKASKAKKTVSAKSAPAKKPAAAKVAVKPARKAATKAAPSNAPVKKESKPVKPAAKVASKPEVKKVAAPAKVQPAEAAKPANRADGLAPQSSSVKMPPVKPTVVNAKNVAIAERRKPLAPAVPADGEDPDFDPSTNLLAGPRNVTPYQAKRGEQYMNKEQLEHFRNILLSWKRDLMEEVDRTVLHMKDEAANFPDPNDRATQESEFSLELRTRDRERKLIRKIDEAIARIDDGSYGYCVETGEEIGIKRLEARPVATLCVEAQERRERRERQYGDRDDRYR